MTRSSLAVRTYDDEDRVHAFDEVDRKRLGWVAFQLLGLLNVATPAAAASLQEVQGFGNNPSNAKMFIYVPDTVAASPPILVTIHYCGGNANAYFTGTGYRALADDHGFIVIYPQTTSSDGCFDVHSDATLKHDGGGDSAGIASMVRYTISKYAANAERVYVTGTSSGAMMTNVLLGAYPDLFKGGAAFAGVPFGCFAGQSAWNSDCSSGMTTKSGQAWGDLVRAAYPGYSGPRPRVQLWHGDQDETLNFHNFGEAIKEWTNVLGVSETPTSTEQNALRSGWTRTRYADTSGVVRVEAVREAGMTHNLTVLADEVVRFFGLDGSADPGGSAGSSVGAGAGGSSGSRNAGAGGTSSAATGGMGPGQGLPNGGSAGSAGGAAGAGAGTDAGGGASGSSGASGAAPSPAVGGRTAVAGAAGAMAMSGSEAGAAPNDAADPGLMGGDGAATQSEEASSSCSIHRVRARGGLPAVLWLILVGVALLRSKRRRSSRA